MADDIFIGTVYFLRRHFDGKLLWDSNPMAIYVQQVGSMLFYRTYNNILLERGNWKIRYDGQNTFIFNACFVSNYETCYCSIPDPQKTED